MSELLRATGLCKEFRRASGRDGAAFAAVADVDLLMEEGSCVSITGHSGSGKTTLLGMLAGLARPTCGTVRFRSRDIHAMTDTERARLHNTELSFMPQGAGLLANLCVRDNIRAPQMFAGRSGAGADRADFLLEAVGLRELAGEFPGSLSGGERRRAVLARALFHAPSLLMADEPTSDLDPENTDMVVALLRRTAELGTAVLVVTHDARVARLGQQRYVMERGRLSPLRA